MAMRRIVSSGSTTSTMHHEPRKGSAIDATVASVLS